MVITEIFRSIQGESTYAGLPCIFVRLTGCNLRCTWCDTAYAFHGGTKMSVDEVLARVPSLPGRSRDAELRCATSGLRQRLKPSLVELTGGEPLLQPEAVALARAAAGRALHRAGGDQRRAVRGRAAARSRENRGRQMP